MNARAISRLDLRRLAELKPLLIISWRETLPFLPFCELKILVKMKVWRTLSERSTWSTRWMRSEMEDRRRLRG
jgi:hypothetical protein